MQFCLRSPEFTASLKTAKIPLNRLVRPEDIEKSKRKQFLQIAFE
jgi:hypothetical protein